MALDIAKGARIGGSWGTIAALVMANGTAVHPLAARLVRPGAAVRDLADAVHSLSSLYGGHPGLIDHVAQHGAQPDASTWLAAAADSFAVERRYLTQLTAASGPLPSTPGQAESESAVVAQRHALEMLASSDRSGCATGAAIGLLLDWSAIRSVLDAAAHRFGVTIPQSALPDHGDTAALVASLAPNPAVERALAFGTQQLLAQHRGLWDLLDARASARDDH